MKTRVDNISKEKVTISDEMETQIMMLENVVESQAQKIKSLEDELNKVKNEVSTTVTPLNEHCEKLEKSVKDFEKT